jgi:hypothetical protein
MDAASQSRPRAWQPLTFGGVAAFAWDRAGRAGLVAAAVAAMVALAVLQFLLGAWSPVIEQAIAALPDESEIRDGRLAWTGEVPAVLAETRLLAFVVDPDRAAEAGQIADVHVAFHAREVRICSLLGCVRLPYAPGWVTAFNRPELEPRWGAWKPAVMLSLAALALMTACASWLALAALAALPVRLLAFYLDRETTLGGALRLALMSLMPGALVMAATVWLYGAQRIGLLGLVLVATLHLPLGVVYAIGATTRLPRLAAGTRPRGNPFAGPSAARAEPPAEQAAEKDSDAPREA